MVQTTLRRSCPEWRECDDDLSSFLPGYAAYQSRTLPRFLSTVTNPSGGSSLTHTVTLMMSILCSMTRGGKVTQIDPESASINPVWRNAVVGAEYVISWQEGPSQKIEEEISQLKTWTSTFHAVAPNDDAYFNEVRARHTISQLSVC